MDYLCFELSFPDIDFDKFYEHSEKVKASHHVHLYTKENEIELRILFEPKTYFGNKLCKWLEGINWRKFGSFLEIKVNSRNNPNLQKIDISDSALIGFKVGSKQFEGNYEYISIKIDIVKLYWLPSQESINTGEFYLNDSGFELVKKYYAPLFGTDDKFSISRMNGMEAYYNIEKASFRPEFNFCFNDDNREAKIIKEPKIQFIYKEKVTEIEAIKYASLISSIASFYFHSSINYTFSRIHLEAGTIEIKKISRKDFLPPNGNLWGFKNYGDFHELMNSNWQRSSLDNYNKLTIVVSRFLHAKNVYDSSKFLIYYSIIEYLKAMDDEINSKFSFISSKRIKNTKCDEAIDILIEIVSQEEKEEFKAKLNSLRNDLKYRPMKRPLEEFLLKNKIDITNCSIDLKKLVGIRNSLIHGSTKIINYDELEQANKLLYRISGILILQLIGVDKWELDLKLN
ncbi:MAG: hypothetical protein J0M08_07990 [Bacteroidetes bacterium]|nr:hypothetical protein [Bacteroidota bacterium]